MLQQRILCIQNDIEDHLGVLAWVTVHVQVFLRAQPELNAMEFQAFQNERDGRVHGPIDI